MKVAHAVQAGHARPRNGASAAPARGRRRVDQPSRGLTVAEGRVQGRLRRRGRYCSVRAPGGFGLTGAGAERQRDAPPRVQMGRPPRQMQDDAAHGGDDLHAELEQPVAQPSHLGAGVAGSRRPQP